MSNVTQEMMQLHVVPFTRQCPGLPWGAISAVVLGKASSLPVAKGCRYGPFPGISCSEVLGKGIYKTWIHKWAAKGLKRP